MTLVLCMIKHVGPITKRLLLGGLSNPLRIAIDRVPFDENRLLIRNKPIVVPVIKSENGDFITEFEDLDMSLWEGSVEYLEDAFGAMLRMMWKR